jgi:hypothetical protein
LGCRAPLPLRGISPKGEKISGVMKISVVSRN